MAVSQSKLLRNSMILPMQSKMSRFSHAERYYSPSVFGTDALTTAKLSGKFHVKNQVVWPHGWPPGYLPDLTTSEVFGESRESRQQSESAFHVDGQVVWPHGWPPGHSQHHEPLPPHSRDHVFGAQRFLGESGQGPHNFSGCTPSGQHFQYGGQTQQTDPQAFKSQQISSFVRPASLQEFDSSPRAAFAQAPGAGEGFTGNPANSRWYATHGLQQASNVTASASIPMSKQDCGGVTRKRKLIDTDFTDARDSALDSSVPPHVRRSERRKQQVAAASQSKTVSNDILKLLPPQFVGAIQRDGRLGDRVPPLVRPIPSKAYLKSAEQQTTVLIEPRSLAQKPLLVILDLNGTLLCRGRSSSNFKRRPGLQHFLAYLLNNHKVMIWSSARPYNVASMVDALAADGLDPNKLTAVWGRDTLGLSAVQYDNKVQVYKQLPWVWSNKKLLRPEDPTAVWNQTNTVLIDDTIEKAIGQPHNLVEVPEFDGNLAREPENGVLQQVEEYLENLRWQSNVSAYIRQNRFACRIPQNDECVVAGEQGLTQDVSDQLTPEQVTAGSQGKLVVDLIREKGQKNND